MFWCYSQAEYSAFGTWGTKTDKACVMKDTVFLPVKVFEHGCTFWNTWIILLHGVENETLFLRLVVGLAYLLFRSRRICHLRTANKWGNLSTLHEFFPSRGFNTVACSPRTLRRIYTHGGYWTVWTAFNGYPTKLRSLISCYRRSWYNILDSCLYSSDGFEIKVLQMWKTRTFCQRMYFYGEYWWC